MRFAKDFQKIFKHERKNVRCVSAPLCHPEWSKAESNPERAGAASGSTRGFCKKSYIPLRHFVPRFCSHSLAKLRRALCACSG